MYDIPYFKAAHPEDVLKYMKAHPFAMICGSDENVKPVATQIPFLFDEREDKLFLQGHFMRKQDHTNAFLKNPNALVVFSGAHTYVSASWYENKITASTWNYQSVQASGKIRFQETDFLFQLLTKLTENFERSDSPSLVKHLPKEYVDQMMPAIIGFEIEVTSVRHVFKLSQNRDKQTHGNIIAKLREHGGDGEVIANEMDENNISKS